MKVNIYADEGYPVYNVEFWSGDPSEEEFYDSEISYWQYKFIEKAYRDFEEAQELLAELNGEKKPFFFEYLRLPSMIVCGERLE